MSVKVPGRARKGFSESNRNTRLRLIVLMAGTTARQSIFSEGFLGDDFAIKYFISYAEEDMDEAC